MRKRVFGHTDDGRTVDEVTLESGDAAISILNWGCVIRDWRVDGAAGSLPMALGFPRFEDYLRHSRSHGAIVGRIANRTKGASFELDGTVFQLTRNHGPNLVHHIHGGAIGLGKRLWDMEIDDARNEVHLIYASPDGEEGYPGAVDFSVIYRLEGAKLSCEMRGMPDRPSPINLAHHAYFNLGGGGTVLDHELWVGAEAYTPLDAENIPLGTIEPVEGTHLDFREPRTIAESDPERLGIDINYVLPADRDPSKPPAWARSPRTGERLQVWTDQPGLQVFNAAKMTIGASGHNKETYGNYAGLCFEAQHFPDSLHNPEWPSIVRTPNDPYLQRLAYAIERD